MCLCLDDFPRSHREGLFTTSAIKYRWKLTNRRLISIYFIVVSALKATCFGRLLDRPRGEERPPSGIGGGPAHRGSAKGEGAASRGPAGSGWPERVLAGSAAAEQSGEEKRAPEPSGTKLSGSCPRRGGYAATTPPRPSSAVSAD